MNHSKSALISVYDKQSLEPLARGLKEIGYELITSGGTARFLEEHDFRVQTVASVTQFPEILGGRVKTLHPRIFGGILANRSDEHQQELNEHGITPIDVVVCNLYPFVQTMQNTKATESEIIEQIDIGGVSLLRAASKNYDRVLIVSHPQDYTEVLERLKQNEVTPAFRKQLALKAFQITADYDQAISNWLSQKIKPLESSSKDLPETLQLSLERVDTLRYGENPHQSAAWYRHVESPSHIKVLQGKALSYNNLLDLDAACAMTLDFDETMVAIIKHTNPCGLALGDNPLQAFEKALACDPLSAFGSIIATNREVDLALVEKIGSLFVEVIVAPSFQEPALAYLQKKKKNCRVVSVSEPKQNTLHSKWTFRSIRDGLLWQSIDQFQTSRSDWRVVTDRTPTKTEWLDLEFAWRVVKHVKSNAILFSKQGATVGVGAGQMSRVDSVRIASEHAKENAKGAVMASDAFFPFSDGVETAVQAGITACIQPGGSKRDEEVIAAANRLGIAMVLTNERHFRH